MSTLYSKSVGMLEQSKNALRRKLEVIADTITDWEEKSRYGTGVRTTTQTIQRVHNIYNEINDDFIQTQERNNLDMDIEYIDL